MENWNIPYNAGKSDGAFAMLDVVMNIREELREEAFDALEAGDKAAFDCASAKRDTVREVWTAMFEAYRNTK